MARRPKGSESDSTTLPRLTASRSDLDRRLEDRITRGRELLDLSIANPIDLQAARSDYGKWDDYNTTLLRRSFSSSEPADEYSAPVPMIFSGNETLEERINDFGRDVSRSIGRLTSLKERLELFDEESEEAPPAASGIERPGGGTTIFVVHGRSEAPKLEVARFLDQVTTLQPVILHEQPNSGPRLLRSSRIMPPALPSLSSYLLEMMREVWLALGHHGVAPGKTSCSNLGSLSEFLGGLE